MLAINLFGNKEYWKEIFWPDVPMFLKAYPVAIMPVIELFGVFTKPFALMVRLFANMMAGHAIILSFTAIIVQMARKNVMLMLPVTLPPPGKIGSNPTRFVVKMKKNTVRRYGA